MRYAPCLVEGAEGVVVFRTGDVSLIPEYPLAFFTCLYKGFKRRAMRDHERHGCTDAGLSRNPS